MFVYNTEKLSDNFWRCPLWGISEAQSFCLTAAGSLLFDCCWVFEGGNVDRLSRFHLPLSWAQPSSFPTRWVSHVWVIGYKTKVKVLEQPN